MVRYGWPDVGNVKVGLGAIYGYRCWESWAIAFAVYYAYNIITHGQEG